MRCRNAASALNTTGSVSVGTWPIPGSETTVMSGRAARMAATVLGSRILLTSPHASNTGTCARPPNNGQSGGGGAPSSLAIAVSQVGVKPAVAAFRVGESGHAPPRRVGLQRQVWQARPQMRGTGVEVRQRRIVCDEAADKFAAGSADLGTDVVQHDAAQQRRPRGADAHGEQSAEAGPDRHDRVQMQRGAQVQHVAQAGLGAVARHVGAASGGAAPGIVWRHDAAPGADLLGEFGKILTGAHQAGQAKQRSADVAGIPLMGYQRQAIPSREAMDYRAHCASRVGVASPLRAR